jgi:hypothetical protein
MTSDIPGPGAGSAAEKAKIRRVVEERGLVGAANDTQWSILINHMRTREDWRPSYRYKCVDGPPSSWDVEWFYHLPFPMMSVEWFDVGLTQENPRGRLFKPSITDHRAWILNVLNEARLSYEVHGDIARIFGYLPRDRCLLGD